MKHKNIAKRMLACGLAVAMVVTGGNYSSVNVSAAKKTKKAAKKAKVKLSKKKASITAGGTVTLKVKKANKKVKWSVKNKKVAKIKSTSGKKKENAAIQGLKKGSTVVVAKVGKVKLKCKITVKANKIKSVSVDKLDYSALTVKFNKKTPLNAGDVKVAVKAYKSGSYNENPKVEALSTKDQKTYRLYLTSGAGLNDFVRVTVGKNSLEVQNKQAFGVKKDSVTVLLEKDVVLKTSLDDAFYQPVGFISYSLKKGSKLPKGLSLVGKRGLLKGIPTEAGTTETTLIGKDEAGRKATLKVIFKVYDETTIAAADSTDNKIKLDDYMVSLNASRLATATPSPAPTATPEYTYDPDFPSVNTPAAATTAPTATVNPEVTPDTNTVYTSYVIAPKGGSGSYKYDLVQTGTDAGVKLSTDVTDSNNQVTKKAAESTKLYIPYGLAAGDHTYSITITDAADATRTTTATVVVKVVENFNVSGTVKDMADNPVAGNESLYFYPSDAKNGSDYEVGRTFLKYTKNVTSSDSFSYINKILTGGNHQADYDAEDYTYFTCANGDMYELYIHGETTKVGPFPMPTILREAPTATPAAPAAATPAPTSTAYVVPAVEAGTYAAEVPAGTYTVKLMGNNGVKYELNDKVTVVADAIGAVNLTMPVRFANIKGVAKFANDKAVMNDEVYFETENKQYEGWTLCADTDYQGAFTASLPAGTYKMYWRDENDQRQYFANPIKVEEGTNAEIGDQKLAVSRFEVTGAFRTHKIDADQGTEVDQLTGNETLMFYDAKGNVIYARTKYDRDYNINEHKYVDGVNHGTFGQVLLDNGTYTVRYNGDRGLSTIGTVTVNGADVKQDFVYNELDAGFTAEYANAAALTLEQEAVYASTGNNDLLVRFAIPETADKTSVPYDVSVAFNGDNEMPRDIDIYREISDGTKTSYSRVTTLDNVRETVYLSAGSYIMNVTPATRYKQSIGNVNIKVSKHLLGYEKSSTALTLDGAVASIVCAKNVQDEDLRYCAYVKIPVVKGQSYEINYAAKTVGAKDLRVERATYDLITNYRHYTKTTSYYDEDDDEDVVSTDTSYADGAGKITFRATGSGDVYLAFRTDSTLYTTIDVSAVVK